MFSSAFCGNESSEDMNNLALSLDGDPYVDNDKTGRGQKTNQSRRKKALFYAILEAFSEPEVIFCAFTSFPVRVGRG
jgi:hypothetical protein